MATARPYAYFREKKKKLTVQSRQFLVLRIFTLSPILRYFRYSFGARFYTLYTMNSPDTITLARYGPQQERQVCAKKELSSYWNTWYALPRASIRNTFVCVYTYRRGARVRFVGRGGYLHDPLLDLRCSFQRRAAPRPHTRSIFLACAVGCRTLCHRPSRALLCEFPEVARGFREIEPLAGCEPDGRDSLPSATGSSFFYFSFLFHSFNKTFTIICTIILTGSTLSAIVGEVLFFSLIHFNNKFVT